MTDISEHIVAIRDRMLQLQTTLNEIEQLPPPFNIWASGARSLKSSLNNTLRYLVKIDEEISYTEEFIKQFYGCHEIRNID